MANGNITVQVDALNLEPVEKLHEAVRQAVALLSRSPLVARSAEEREAHNLLRQALAGMDAPAREPLGFKLTANMQAEQAAQLLEEAIARIRSPYGRMEVGGAYWRCAKVLECFLDPKLDDAEGSEHAQFIRKTHGRILPAA